MEKNPHRAATAAEGEKGAVIKLRKEVGKKRLPRGMKTSRSEIK